MPTTAELQDALNQSIKQLATLTEIKENKKKYDQKGDQLEAVVNDNNSFSQKETPYDTKYPYNISTATESGHLFEMDDTPGAERVNLTHRTGTFFEVHPDGSKTEKVVNDEIKIIQKNNEVYIMGNEQRSTQGNLKIYIKGNAKVQVDGDVELEVVGNFTMKVGGMFTAMAESFNLVGPINHVGDINSTGNFINQGNISSAKNIQAELDFVGHRDLYVDQTGYYGVDAIADGVSLVNHVHVNSGGTGNSGKPAK